MCSLCSCIDGAHEAASLIKEFEGFAWNTFTGMILGLRPTNERRRYKVTPSLICWAQILNQPCIYLRKRTSSSVYQAINRHHGEQYVCWMTWTGMGKLWASLYMYDIDSRYIAVEFNTNPIRKEKC